MSDYLLDLGQKPLAKKLVKRLNLPIALPETLRRASGSLSAHPLSGLRVVIQGGDASNSLLTSLQSLTVAGGGELVDANDTDREAAIHGMVFDATALASPQALAVLFEFFQPRLSQLATSGRIIVLGIEPSAARDASAAATQAALTGFVKSLAKEVGRKGATAQLVTLDSALAQGKSPADATRRTEALSTPITYLLSERSAYVSGQVLPLSGLVLPPESKLRSPTRPLAGKKAVVTGAAHGIGHAIARRLAEEGAELLCVDHPTQHNALAAVVAGLASEGQALPIDLARPDAARELATHLEKVWGSVDILVNNAGVTRDKTLARMSRSAWDLTVDVNLGATIAITHALLGGDGALIHLLQPEGRIICLASIAGIAGNTGQTNYAAAKSGVIGYVRQLAPRLAARGITINALAPGFIDTRMTQAMPITIREVARRFNALKQAGKPEDVAEACLFLATPGAHAITGAALRVCGLNHLGA